LNGYIPVYILKKIPRQGQGNKGAAVPLDTELHPSPETAVIAIVVPAPIIYKQNHDTF